MYFDAWLQLINESFLVVGTSAAVNLFYLEFNNYGNWINSVITLVVLLIILTFPFIIMCLYLPKSNFDKILQGDEEFLAKYGSILENLNFARMGKKVLIFIICGFIRKQLLICATVFTQKNQNLVIISMIVQAQMMIMIIGEFPPYKDGSQNNMELLNEFFVILTNYHLLLLTEFLSDDMTR